ncbi:MAG TPA: 5'/3'-nucleotidase SurE [Deltaproteobacteria bacterium]|nr:5'/3'-nucleotidase SurE [Deltaproteobacteria bacterium]
MRILLSNDDGIDAPGLRILAERLSATHEVWVVAPATEQSAKSHSLTMREPLRVSERGPRRFAITGTPADCVYIAVHDLLPEPPELVLSGINDGSNLGNDVYYSGTVAAAREAVLHGHTAIAISLERGSRSSEPFWDTAATIAARLVERAPTLPPRTLLNVNVPNLPLPRIQGLRACRLGERIYAPAVERRTDPRGKLYVWIGGPHLRFEGGSDADGIAVGEGWVSLTPLDPDATDRSALASLARWTEA